MSETNQSAVIMVLGSVVDIGFDEHLPTIYSVLYVGNKGRMVIEVLAKLDERRVGGIAMPPTQGLACGMVVRDPAGRTKLFPSP